MRKIAWYSRVAKAIAHVSAKPKTFSVAVGVIAVWLTGSPEQ